MKTSYRIAECLLHPNTEYARVAKCAITQDGKRHEIQTTKEGEEYFEISNPYYTPTGKIHDDLAEHFYNHFTDAVQAVRDGYAHAILGNPNPTNVFQGQSRAIYMLDEKVGEEYRQKTIEGFKDSVFGYNVKFGSKSSFGGYNLVNTDLKPLGWFNPGVPAFFDTYDDADTFIMNAFNEAKTAASLVVNGEKTFKEALDSLDSMTIISDMFFDLLEEGDDETISYKNNGDLKDYGYDIVQAIKITEIPDEVKED